MLGEKLRELWKAKGLLQRQVAARLNVDTAYISKMERNDKPVSPAHIKELALVFDIREKELKTWWLAEKIWQLSLNDSNAKEAIKLVLGNMKGKTQ